jgi:flavin reductase (DIM6/NTAB) family NADH-FMN oxidoreductase RutF
MNRSIFSLINPELYVITAAHAGQWGGQITTWVTVGALVPEHLRVVTILSPRNFTFGLVQHSGHFVVNLLAQGQQDWLPLFGLCSMREVDKFAGIPIQKSPSGVPILPNICGWAECQVVQSVDLGDRTVIIADVLHHEVYDDLQPLRRVEALATLQPEVAQALAAKRVLDIECDRGLIKTHHNLNLRFQPPSGM